VPPRAASTVTKGQPRSPMSAVAEYLQVKLQQLRTMIVARSSKLAMQVRFRRLLHRHPPAPPAPAGWRHSRSCEALGVGRELVTGAPEMLALQTGEHSDATVS
jgi:hypothetical protein